MGCGDDEAAPTVAPPPAPAATEPAPVSHAAPDLEALLPDEVAGVALEKGSATGAAVFGGNEFSEAMTAFLASRGKEPGDLRFANARDPAGTAGVEAGVFEVEGVGAPALRDAIVEASRPAAPGAAVSSATVGGKPVTALEYASGSTLYLYAAGDRVFYAGSTDEELAGEVLAGFP
jgi:hypothetical protein